jgi:hypothetical protein
LEKYIKKFVGGSFIETWLIKDKKKNCKKISEKRTQFQQE